MCSVRMLKSPAQSRFVRVSEFHGPEEFLEEMGDWVAFHDSILILISVFYILMEAIDFEIYFRTIYTNTQN